VEAECIGCRVLSNRSQKRRERIDGRFCSASHWLIGFTSPPTFIMPASPLMTRNSSSPMSPRRRAVMTHAVSLLARLDSDEDRLPTTPSPIARMNASAKDKLRDSIAAWKTSRRHADSVRCTRPSVLGNCSSVDLSECDD